MNEATTAALQAIFNDGEALKIYYVVSTEGSRRIMPVTISSIDPALVCTLKTIDQSDKLPSNSLDADDVHETKLAAFTAFEAGQAAELVIAERDRDAKVGG